MRKFSFNETQQVWDAVLSAKSMNEQIAIIMGEPVLNYKTDPSAAYVMEAFISTYHGSVHRGSVLGNMQTSAYVCGTNFTGTGFNSALCWAVLGILKSEYEEYAACMGIDLRDGVRSECDDEMIDTMTRERHYFGH